VVSDDHEGLRSAQDKILSRSRVAEDEEFHFLHNLLDLVPKKRRKELTAKIRNIFDRCGSILCSP